MQKSIDTVRLFKQSLEKYINSSCYSTDKVSINTLLELISVDLEPQCRVAHFYITTTYSTCVYDVKLEHLQNQYRYGIELISSLNEFLRLYYQNRLQLDDLASLLERIDENLYDLRGFTITCDIKLEQWAQV